ncbi:MAG: hypothetical protein ABIT70_09305 [Sulfuriferula sp.]
MFRQAGQRVANGRKRDACFFRNFQIEQLAVLFQAIDNGGGMHPDFLVSEMEGSSHQRYWHNAHMKDQKQKSHLFEVALWGTILPFSPPA